MNPPRPLPVRPHLRPQPRLAGELDNVPPEVHTGAVAFFAALKNTVLVFERVDRNTHPLAWGYDLCRWRARHEGALPPDIDLGEPTDDELLSDWERRFQASLDTWEGELTSRQQAKLDETEESLKRRREMCRQGLCPRYIR
jgi:hypothetical protein